MTAPLVPWRRSANGPDRVQPHGNGSIERSNFSPDQGGELVERATVIETA